MSRAPKVSLGRVLAGYIAIVVVAVGLVFLIGYDQPAQVTTSPTGGGTVQQTTDIKYKGVQGKTALALLKKYADVQTKKYSFGELVTSINGTPGNGPKYWSFYVNGKLSAVGASTYVTHNGDAIEWRLEKL